MMLVIPWGSRWWLGLTVNQFAAGSIPAYGAVAVLHWFRDLTVNQVHVGSIPIGHLWRCAEVFSFQFFCRIRLLARSAAFQATGRRSKLLCGTTEGIRQDEETVLKTVGGSNRFGVRVPGLSLSKSE